MVTTHLKGPWDRAEMLPKEHAKRVPKAIDAAMAGAAMRFRAEVSKTFTAQGVGGVRWSPISVLTQQLRAAAPQLGRGSAAGKGTNALIVRGDLRRSVAVHKAGRGTYFVGVHRSDANYNVARVHEQPAAKTQDDVFKIRVTPKMRRWFLWLYLTGVIGAPLAKGTRYILIKRRSFLASTWEAKKEEISQLAVTRYRNVVLTGKVGAARARWRVR